MYVFIFRTWYYLPTYLPMSIFIDDSLLVSQPFISSIFATYFNLEHVP